MLCSISVHLLENPCLKLNKSRDLTKRGRLNTYLCIGHSSLFVPAMQRKEQLMNNAGKNMYEKLTIRDKFMFGKVTKNPVIAQKMADLLTPVEMGEVKGVEREKFLQHRSSSKYVKLDMYLEDENGRVVDTEMQNKSQNRVVQEELPLRVRDTIRG